MEHLSNWIEIPAVDLARATRFYEAILEVTLVPMEVGATRYALFPTRDRFNAGAIAEGEGYTPSADGPLLYLDGTHRMDAVLARVTPAGGRVLQPKTHLSVEAGEVAIFLDSEGNRIGLQAAVQETGAVSDDAMRGLLGGRAPGVAFLIRRGPAYEDPTTAPLQWEHARNMFALLRAGKLRSVTALMDGTDVLGLGLFEGTRDDAEATLREDPGVKGGRLRVEVFTEVTFTSGDTRL